MDNRLKVKAFVSLAVFPLVLGAVIFLSAGTLNFWDGWLFLIVFALAATLTTLIIMKNDSSLLARRMKSGPTAEKRTPQRIIMSLVIVLFVAMIVVSGIDYRLSWSHMPVAVVLAGDFMIALGFVIYHFVFLENSFASATIEITEGQKVISTGPYQLIRHPMYFGGLINLLGIPFALGSWWALLTFVPLLPLFIWRIVDEEKLLNKQLEGYVDYCARVKYRLIPWLF